ncbi:cytochrome c oxidase subunit 12, mitochondrial-like [Aristolochia californica]|uniref:cytochrome c oxidase subunit 12, mitochondrial-like n=1 Tax=Aristolochia californica TaxID=171875 RepID=UPI0035D7E810
MAEIEIKTAPADFWFPTTNQTRHCFTQYIEYHRCVATKAKIQANVKSLLNTTTPFAQENGLTNGMSREKMALSLVLSDFGQIGFFAST